MPQMLSTMQSVGFYSLMLGRSSLNIGTNEQIKIAPFLNEFETLVNFLCCCCFCFCFCFLFCLLLVSVGSPDASRAILGNIDFACSVET